MIPLQRAHEALPAQDAAEKAAAATPAFLRAVPLRLSHRSLLLSTLVLAAAYLGYSFLSSGFYQHDEAAHFLNMRDFWHDPNLVLGNWAKPGYKLLFAIPALLGPWAVLLTNCLIAAFCCYLAYRLAEAAGCRSPLFAFVLLAAQPLWLQLSFRNYSEPVTALLLLLAILLHYRKQHLPAALVLSYTLILRQELYPIVLLYGLYLLYERNLLPALMLPIFPAVNHLWGWIATGDPLYLLHQVVGSSQRLQNEYQRQGFDHYFEMSLTIFGALALVFFLVYLAQVALRRQRLHLFLLVPLTIFFLEHALFNLQWVRIGPSTGGNLRYMLVIAPLVAVLGALAADRLPDGTFGYRRKLLLVLVPLVLVAAVFLRYEHNNLVLLQQTSYLPVAAVLLAVLGVLLPLRKEALLLFTAASSLYFTVLAVRPIERSAEDAIMAQIVEGARKHGIHEQPLLANHTMFFFYYGKSRHDFPAGAAPITRESVEQAAPGTVILWDSHYSYRPGLHDDQVTSRYFTERPEQYQIVLPPVATPDGRFLVMGFKKLDV